MVTKTKATLGLRRFPYSRIMTPPLMFPDHIFSD